MRNLYNDYFKRFPQSLNPLNAPNWINAILVTCLVLILWRKFAALIITRLLFRRYGVSIDSIGFFSLKKLVLCERSAASAKKGGPKPRVLFSIDEIALKLNWRRHSLESGWRMFSIVGLNPKFYIYLQSPSAKEPQNTPSPTGNSGLLYKLLGRWKRTRDKIATNVSRERQFLKGSRVSMLTSIASLKRIFMVLRQLVRFLFWLVDFNVLCLVCFVHVDRCSAPLCELLVASLRASCSLNMSKPSNPNEFRTLAISAILEAQGTRLCHAQATGSNFVEAYVMKSCFVELSSKLVRPILLFSTVSAVTAPTWRCRASDVDINEKQLLQILQSVQRPQQQKPTVNEQSATFLDDLLDVLATLSTIKFVPLLELNVANVRARVSVPWGAKHEFRSVFHFAQFSTSTSYFVDPKTQRCTLGVSSALENISSTLAKTGNPFFSLESFKLDATTSFLCRTFPKADHLLSKCAAADSVQISGNVVFEGPSLELHLPNLFSEIRPVHSTHKNADILKSGVQQNTHSSAELDLSALFAKLTLRFCVSVQNLGVLVIGEQQSFVQLSLSFAKADHLLPNSVDGAVDIGQLTAVACSGTANCTVCDFDGFQLPVATVFANKKLSVESVVVIGEELIIDLSAKALHRCLMDFIPPISLLSNLLVPMSDASSKKHAAQRTLALPYAVNISWCFELLRVKFPEARRRYLVCSVEGLLFQMTSLSAASFGFEQLLVQLLPLPVLSNVSSDNSSAAKFSDPMLPFMSPADRSNTGSETVSTATSPTMFDSSLKPPGVLVPYPKVFQVLKFKGMWNWALGKKLTVSVEALSSQLQLQSYILCHQSLQPLLALLQLAQRLKQEEPPLPVDSNGDSFKLACVAIAYVNLEVVLPNSLPTRLFGRNFIFKPSSVPKNGPSRAVQSFKFLQGLYWNCFVPISAAESVERNFISVEPAELFVFAAVDKLDSVQPAGSAEEKFCNRVFKIIADKWSFHIPHQFILSDLIDNFIAAFKAVRLHHGILPKTEPPNLRIDISDRSIVDFNIKKFEFLFEESLLEQRLSVIFELGLQQRQIEQQRQADFQRFSVGAAFTGSRNGSLKSRLGVGSGSKSGLVHLYPEATAAQLDKVRDMAELFQQEYNARSWIYAVKSWYSENPCILQDIPIKNSRPVKKNKKQLLCNFTATAFKLTFVPPELPADTVQKAVHLYDQRVPEDYMYDDLFSFSIELNARSIQVSLRDYPLPMFSLDGGTEREGFSMRAKFVIAEQLAHYQSTRKIFLPLFEDEEPILVTRTINALKTFGQCEIVLDSDEDVLLTYGSSYDAAFELVSQIMDTFNKPNIDRSPMLSSVDKLRFMLHGKCRILTRGNARLKYHVLGSRSPYFHNEIRKLHGASASRIKHFSGHEGFFCIAGPNVDLKIKSSGQTDEPDLEFVCDTLMSELPNAKPLSCNVESRRAVLCHFTGGVHVKASVNVDTGKFSPKNHPAVVLQIPELTETGFSGREYDAYAGFRSSAYHIDVSIKCMHIFENAIVQSNYININANSLLKVVNALELNSSPLSCLQINKGAVFKGSLEGNLKPNVIKLLRSIDLKLQLTPLLVGFVQDTDTQNGCLGVRVLAKNIQSRTKFVQHTVSAVETLLGEEADATQPTAFSPSDAEDSGSVKIDKDTSAWGLEEAKVVVDEVEARVFAAGDALDYWKDDDAFNCLKHDVVVDDSVAGGYCSIYAPNLKSLQRSHGADKPDDASFPSFFDLINSKPSSMHEKGDSKASMASSSSGSSSSASSFKITDRAPGEMPHKSNGQRAAVSFKYWMLFEDTLWAKGGAVSATDKGIFMHKFVFAPKIEFFRSHSANSHAIENLINIQQIELCETRIKQLNDEENSYVNSLQKVEFRRQVFDSTYWRLQEKLMKNRIGILQDKKKALAVQIAALKSLCQNYVEDNGALPRVHSSRDTMNRQLVKEERFGHNYVVHCMQGFYNSVVRNILIRFVSMQTRTWTFQYFHQFVALSVFNGLLEQSDAVMAKLGFAKDQNNVPNDSTAKRRWKTKFQREKNMSSNDPRSELTTSELAENIVESLLDEVKKGGNRGPAVSSSESILSVESGASKVPGVSDWKSEWESNRNWLKSAYRPSLIPGSPNYVPKDATVAANLIVHCVYPQINFESCLPDQKNQLVSVLLGAERAVVQGIEVYDFDGQQDLLWSAVSDADLRERLIKSRLTMEVESGRFYVARGNRELQKNFAELQATHSDEGQLLLDPNFLDYTGQYNSRFQNLACESFTTNVKGVWPLWVPLESFVDPQQPTGNLRNIVDHMRFGLWRDSVNRLYLKGDVADNKSTDSTRIWFPRITLEADGDQFYSIVEIIRTLLIYKDPSGAARSEKMQSTAYSLEQGAKMQEIKDAVLQMQRKIRQLETYIGYSVDDLEGERSRYVARLLHYREDLYTVMLAARELTHNRRMMTREAGEVELAWKAQVEIDTMRWILKKVEQQNRSDLALATLHNAEFAMTHFQNLSSDMAFMIGQVYIRNLLSGSGNSNFVELLAPFKYTPQVSGSTPQHLFSKGQPMVRISLCELPPVAGISVLDHLEIIMYPMLIQLTNEMGHELYAYFFPEKQETSLAATTGDSPSRRAADVKSNDGGTGESLSLQGTSIRGAELFTGVGQAVSLLEQKAAALSSGKATMELLSSKSQELDKAASESNVSASDAEAKMRKSGPQNLFRGLRHRSRSTLDIDSIKDTNDIPSGSEKYTPLPFARTHSFPDGVSSDLSSENILESKAVGRPRNAAKGFFGRNKLNSAKSPADATEKGVSEVSGKAQNGAVTNFAEALNESGGSLDFLLNESKRDQWSLMKERAALNRTFIYIKISGTYMCLSYKGPKEKNFLDLDHFVFSLPTLEYRNRLWTSLELVEAVKKDILHVAFLHVGSLVKEKFFLRKKKSTRFLTDSPTPLSPSPTATRSDSGLRSSERASSTSPSVFASSKLSKSFFVSPNSPPSPSFEMKQDVGANRERTLTDTSSKSSITSKMRLSRIFSSKKADTASDKTSSTAEEKKALTKNEKGKLLFGNNYVK